MEAGEKLLCNKYRSMDGFVSWVGGACSYTTAFFFFVKSALFGVLIEWVKGCIVNTYCIFFPVHLVLQSLNCYEQPVLCQEQDAKVVVILPTAVRTKSTRPTDLSDCQLRSP